MKFFYCTILLLGLILTACAPVAVTSEPTQPLPTATFTPTELPSPTLSPTEALPTITPSPTPFGGSQSIIAHFYLPATAINADQQGLYLVTLNERQDPVLLKSFPSIALNHPLVKFSPDGHYLLVAPLYPTTNPEHMQKTLDIYEISTGEVHSLAPIDPDAEITEISWSPDGRWVMVMYYFFGGTANYIDLYQVVDGTKIGVNNAAFSGWLPDSSGILTQTDQYYLFDLAKRQLTPYLANPRTGNMRLMAILPEMDAALLQSGQDLYMVPQVSKFASPANWDMTLVENEAVLLGVIPEGSAYYSANFMVSPSENLLLVSDSPYQQDYYTHLYHLDGSEPVKLYSGIVPVAWSPDETAFLGIRFKDAPHRGAGNYSGTPHEVVYTIQPISNDLEPVELYSLPPTCGLWLDEARSFAQSRLMLDCVFSADKQDVFWE